MSANTTAKSILETTADSGIAALHRGGRAAIYGRVAQHERLSPFRAGLAGLKPGDLLNPLRGSKEPLFHICAGAEGVIRNDHYAKLDPAQVSVLYFVPASADPWKSGHSWPRCGNAKECRPLEPRPTRLNLLNSSTRL